MGHATSIAAFAIACAIIAPMIASGQDLSKPVNIATPISDTLFGRIDTNVRGTESDGPEVISMSPATYNARTLTDRPTLYWFLSLNTESAVRFALREVANRVSTTVLECEVPGPIAAGVHTIRLADHGVVLRTDRRYSWFVRFQSAGARDPVDSTSFINFGDLGGAAAMRGQLSGASPQIRYAETRSSVLVRRTCHHRRSRGPGAAVEGLS